MKLLILLSLTFLNFSLVFSQSSKVMPQFPGGEEALYTFLNNNLIYPQEAKENVVSGTVNTTFTIEKDGSISNASIVNGIGFGCDKEALRVISLMPNWTPGYLHDSAVRVQYNLPVLFLLVDNIKPVNSLPDKREKPEFQGGKEGYFKYLRENLVYPDNALRNGIEGTVVATFMIHEDGSTSNVKIEIGLGYGCDEEVIRFIQNMPPWRPFLINGIPQKCEKSLQIFFELTSKSNENLVIRNDASNNINQGDFFSGDDKKEKINYKEKPEIEQLYLKGLEASSGKKYKKAIKFFDKLIETDPGCAKAYLKRGQAKIKIEDKAGACTDFKKAVEFGINIPEDALRQVCD